MPALPTLAELEDAAEFTARHIGPDAADGLISTGALLALSAAALYALGMTMVRWL